MKPDTLVDRVWAALGQVRDPELDEPITDLGFVASHVVDDAGRATVHLRLPTYFCAANFAYLMVADTRDALAAIDDLSAVEVVLDDHFASAEITGGVGAGSGFAGSFPGLAEGELDALRRDFARKAVLAATDRVCRPLVRGGRTPAQLAALTLGDVPPSSDVDRLVARRRELGLTSDRYAPLVVDPSTGEAVPAELVERHLGSARLTRVSLEANGEVCRGLLNERYPTLTIRTPTTKDPSPLP